jgi:hypothetical protein
MLPFFVACHCTAFVFSDYGTSHGTVTECYPFGLFYIRNRFLCIEISGWKSAPYPRLEVPAPVP